MDALEDESAYAAGKGAIVFVDSGEMMSEAALLLEFAIANGTFELADGGVETHMISMMRFCFKSSSANDASMGSLDRRTSMGGRGCAIFGGG